MARIHRKKSVPRKWMLHSRVMLLFLLLVCGILVWQSSMSNDPRVDNPLLTLDHPRAEDVLDQPEVYVYKRQCSVECASIASVTQCYPDAPLQQPWLHRRSNGKSKEANLLCSSHLATNRDKPLDWKTLQQCWVGNRNSNNTPKISVDQFQIHVIGERNSGTKWLQQELGKCFPRDKVGVRCHRDFLRSKHFFQPPVRGQYETNIVIAIVRDPIEWVAAMREKPYHMPYHMAGFDHQQPNKLPPIPLDWQTFVQRAAPWTLPEQSAHDQAVIQSGRQQEVTCVQGFAFDEVTPCIFDNTTIPRSKWRGHMPIYELQRDRSGKPFDDLLKLRSDKILNFFVEIPLLMQLGGYMAVRYEDLLRDGTRSFLEQVAHIMGMDAIPDFCKPQPPRPQQIGRREIPSALQKWVEDHLVLETEQLLGYR